MSRARVFLAIALVAACTSGCRTASPVPAQLDGLFSDLHARGLFDGAVVVSDARGVVFEKGYGFANVEAQAAFTPDTPADGGSLAKTFTAALLLSLHEEGALSLDDPAQKLLPELPYPDVTLRDLLRHTSGLLATDYESLYPFLPADEVRTTETLLRVVAQQKPALRAKPGTAFEYSSFAYDLALLAASRAAGRPASDLLAQRILRPLGMTSAFARPGRFRDFKPPRTLGYQRGQSIVYVSNNTIEPWLQKSIVRAVRNILNGGHRSMLREPAMRPIAKDEPALLAGEWKFDGGERVTIDAENQSIFVTREKVRYRIVQIGERWFYIPGLDWIVGVAPSPEGRLDRIYRSGNDAEAWGSRVR